MPKDVREKPISQSNSFPSPLIQADTIFRVLSVLQAHSSGVKLRDLMSELGVSRLTLLKWLHRMEDDDLLYRTNAVHGRKGRPEVLYHLSEGSLRTISNSGGTFVLTGVGKSKGQRRLHLLENSVDFSTINKSIIDLDENIFASSIIDNIGTLIVHGARRGYEGRLNLDEEMSKKWGPWAAIIAGVAEQGEKLLNELQYIAIGHKDFKDVIIPFNQLDLLVRLTVQRSTEASSITDKVSRHLNRLARSNSF